LILGTVGIIIFIAALLILALYKGKKKEQPKEVPKEIPTVDPEIERVDKGWACKPEAKKRGLKKTTPLRYKMKGGTKAEKPIEINPDFLLNEAPLPDNFPQTTEIPKEEALDLQGLKPQ